MASFVNLVKPKATRPRPDVVGSPVMRDQLTMQAWLEVGACLSVPIILAARQVIGSWALLLPFAAIFFRIARTTLKVFGVLPNEQMNGVLLNKFSAQIPNDDGTFGPKAASKGVTVFMIGAKSNHPMGAFGPHFRDIGDRMTAMQKEINKDAEKFGMLGSTAWMDLGRETNNEVMWLMYFKDADGPHKYAHSPLHRDAWNWWNKHIAEIGHVSIWHEIFVVPAGSWENIYVNSKPNLMAATHYPRKAIDGTTQWLSPVVDARKGVLKSSQGRMTRTDGKDNDRYKGDPYEAYGKLEAQY